jgi:isocitrate dehydrogenase
MSKTPCASFIAAEIEDAKKQGVLLSVHLKATMMKVSDPIMFGQIVAEFYKDALAKHADVLAQIGFNLNNGIGDLYARIKALPAEKQAEIEADIQAVTPPPCAGDGQLRQRHHQPARAERRHRRRLDASHDP